MIVQLTQELQAFAVERGWAKHHTPQHLAQALSVEAAELLECYLWGIQRTKREKAEEMADVLSYLILLAAAEGVDLEAAVKAKVAKNRQRFPTGAVEEFRRLDPSGVMP